MTSCEPLTTTKHAPHNDIQGNPHSPARTAVSGCRPTTTAPGADITALTFWRHLVFHEQRSPLQQLPAVAQDGQAGQRLADAGEGDLGGRGRRRDEGINGLQAAGVGCQRSDCLI
jgi:hypothetical protein